MPHVLIVDDDAQIRRMLRAVLERAGHSVTDAADGASALRLIQSNAFHLIITDMYMPEMDGVELTRALRALGDATPIVAISGNTAAPTLKVAKRLGAQMTLVKPFELSALLDAVDELLSRPESP